ncbi:hydroxyacid dehydrogenase [bacterium]|nr:hydroxyacid dehydrogenase [bacterium]
MKVVFFNLTKEEKNYFETNLSKDIVGYFYSESFDSTYIPNNEIKDAEAISIFVSGRIDAQSLKKFPNLKYIFTRSVGFDHIGIDYCNSKNIKIYNAKHYGDNTIAEYTFAILLSVIRNIPSAMSDVKAGKVKQTKYRGLELHGKTLGIIGLGSVGRQVAKIAQGFSMNVICYDIEVNPSYKFVSLDELFEKSDIITLHTPYSAETENIINASAFSKMKKGVVLVNTARGELVDVDSLIENLNNEKVLYVASDVLECENILHGNYKKDFCLSCVDKHCLQKFFLNNKLMNKSNVLVTPHIAYNTHEAVKRILEITLKNIENAKRGILDNVVN